MIVQLYGHELVSDGRVKFTKDPSEVTLVEIDYRDDLPEGVSIDSVDCDVRDMRSGLDVTADLLVSSPSLDQVGPDPLGDNAFSFNVQNGLPGHPYRIKLVITLDDLITVDVRYMSFRVQAPRP